MGRHRFSVHVAAPPERVFEVWTDLDRAHEWIEGLTAITDVTGPPDRAGTRYVSHFGRMQSPSEVLGSDPPRRISTRFGSWLLRGVTSVTFAPDRNGTRLTQEFVTKGIIPAITARVFSIGSYRGSFRGELASFVRIAERDAVRPTPEIGGRQ